MHHKIIPAATDAQLRDFLMEEFDELKSWDMRLYDLMEDRLYEKVYGPHFSEACYEKAMSCLKNRDGTAGAHWSLSDIVSYAKSKGITFDHFNEYDLAYAMNMVYSDYYGIVPDTTESYFKMARAFLEDEDAPKGKAYLYYKAMKCR